MKFWHGRVSYKEGQLIQEESSLRVQVSGQPEIHGFEFDPVITLGRRASPEQDLCFDKSVLEQKGFSVFHVDRGGEATLHNPGQLVIYPIVNLRSLNLGVRDFVEIIQDSTVELLKAYGVNSGLIPGYPGVYTSKGKIGFIGVRIQNSVSTHGLSLNVSNELEDFHNIRSCGILRPQLDRLHEWSVNASNKELHLRWSEVFLKRLLLDQEQPSRLTHEPFPARS